MGDFERSPNVGPASFPKHLCSLHEDGGKERLGDEEDDGCELDGDPCVNGKRSERAAVARRGGHVQMIRIHHVQRQLRCWLMNPAMMGPQTGPRKGLAEKAAMGSPICWGAKRSATWIRGERTKI